MLSAKTKTIVKSTAPILANHGVTVTNYFYKRMFSKNPEVLPFFNQADFERGLQQKTLAAALYAYANNIDNLIVIGNTVELIAQKHASLQIKREHFPIVGENLLAALQEVLKLPADSEIIAAWTEAYNFLADILINRQEQIYHEQTSKVSGWEGFKQFRVLKKEAENDFITSFYLFPADGQALPLFKPGQYITLRVPSSCNSTTVIRNYSLSHKPGMEWFRISVKRESGEKLNVPDGYASNFLHAKINVGSILEVAPPCGDFYFDMSVENQRPLLLLAGGIGITPILSILKSALEIKPEHPIIFVHGILDEKSHVFKKTIDELSQKHSNLKVYYRYSQIDSVPSAHLEPSSTGFIDGPFIKSIIPYLDCEYYFCGPKPFMLNIYNYLKTWAVPKSQMHFEFFGPRQELDRQDIKL